MDDQLITIIFALVAGVVFYQLYRVLGTRTGNEKPPFDSSISSKKQQTHQNMPNPANASDNVITLPQRPTARVDDFSEIDAIAKPDSAINVALRNIKKQDQTFSVKAFLDGVRVAYEMILIAFAKNDRATLKSLLANDVYEGFSSVIDEREKNNENVKFSFVGLDKADIATVSIDNNEAHITLHLVSEIISATYDANEKLIDGDPQTIVEVKDLWTFSRNLKSNNPNWLLTATEEDQ